ncbi:MAG TPA: hypothetical protein VGQ09_14140 [Chitinophagaceae bacterium]|jgi:hypothetical protein|nr:hypothetical protein [Chitinophagaceae bacterium]
MIPEAIHYEVLFFTCNQFSKRQFCEKNDCHSDHSTEGQLQRACWDGLVFEILPDIIENPLQKGSEYIWEVEPAENFIEIKIGAAPGPVELATSVNPYLFLFKKNFN